MISRFLNRDEDRSEPDYVHVKRIGVKRYRFFLCGNILFFCILVVVCQKKSKQESFVLTCHGDTLTAIVAARLDPGDQTDSAHFVNVLIRRSLAGCAKTSFPDSLYTLFASQLSMESSTEWSTEAAGLLLDAAQVLRMRIAQDESCSTTVAYAESLFYALIPEGKILFPAVSREGCDPRSLKWMSRFFSDLFNIGNQLATALAVFTNDQSISRSEQQSAEDVVKGLVSSNPTTSQDNHSVLKRENKPSRAKIPDTNPEDILKYRDQQSILDSISKHISEIKALYKKYLKKDSDLSGKIVVTFLVAADGNVAHVSAAKSDIDDNGFLDPFLIYIKTIRFKPVPQKAGTMTFEFPFEFNNDI